MSIKTLVLFVGCGAFALFAPPVRADEATATKTKTTDLVNYASFDEAMYKERKLRDLDELDERRHALQSAIDLASTPRDKCEAHRLLISVHALADDLGLMCESLDYVLENAPQPATASLTLRSALYTARSKDWEGDFKDIYESRLEANPKDRIALTVLARMAYLITRDHSQHGMYLDRLIALDREQSKSADPEMLNLRATTFMYESKNKESAELFESVSRDYQDFASTSLVKAATSWVRAREFEKAIAAAKRAHEIGPDRYATRDVYRWHRELGELFLKQAHPAEAIEHLEAAKENARIDAYREQCEDLLVQAKAMMALKN